MIKKTMENIKRLVASFSVEVISDRFLGTDCSNIYTFKCLRCDNIFNRTYPSLLTNRQCPKCKKKNFIQYNSLKNSDIVDFLLNKNISLISDYISARKPIKVKCNICNHIFNNAFCNIKAGSGCSKCANGAVKVEENVREVFESILKRPFPSVRPSFLKNPDTGRNLELDGYCEELKLAFEYDGEFHYIESPWHKNGLSKRKQLDKLKNTLCKNNEVQLIRISYLDKDNLKNVIKQKLKELL